MTVNYWLYGDDIKKYSFALDKEAPVEIPIMNRKDKIWVKARVVLYQKPEKDTESVALLGPYGQPYEEGKYHIKILQILSEEE